LTASRHVLELVVAPPTDVGSTGTHGSVLMTDSEGTALAFGSRDRAEHLVSIPRCATFRFRPGSSRVTAHAEPDADGDYVQDAYYNVALPFALQVVLGRQALHASGALVAQAGVVAFCGFSGAGKTTLAYGLSRRGHAVWGDDVVAFDASGRQTITSLRLPFELNLREASAAFFGATDARAGDLGEEPREWESAPLAAVYILEQVDGRRSLQKPRRLAPDEALVAVLAHAYTFQPQTDAERRRMMRDYLELVARVPVFRLPRRPGFDTLPALLDEIEDAAGRRVGAAS